MKKTLTITFVGLLLTSFVSCDYFKGNKNSQDIETLAASNDSLSEALERSNSEYDDLLKSIDQIQESFQAINEAENIVTVETAKGESGSAQSILDNMAKIEQKMRYNRELIGNLQNQLARSNGKNAKLNSTIERMLEDFKKKFEAKNNDIDSLKQVLEKQNIRIQSQQDTIQNLSSNVARLSASNAEQQRSLVEKENQMNKVYYVFGTKKELRKQNILDKNGVLMNSDFNSGYFAEADARTKKSIPLYAKKVKVMTSHPSNSYRLVYDSNKQCTLQILDPKQFWSVSKYLVIVVK